MPCRGCRRGCCAAGRRRRPRRSQASLPSRVTPYSGRATRRRRFGSTQVRGLGLRVVTAPLEVVFVVVVILGTLYGLLHLSHHRTSCSHRIETKVMHAAAFVAIAIYRAPFFWPVLLLPSVLIIYSRTQELHKNITNITT